jgi:hypothetical protein
VRPQRSASLLGLTGLIVAGCGGAGHAAMATPTATDTGPLVDVPADTAYLVAFNIGSLTALGDYASAETLTSLRDSFTRGLPPPEARSPLTRALADAVAAPLATLPARFGVDPAAPILIYGRGPWPVLRLRLDDAAPLRALLAQAVDDHDTVVSRGAVASHAYTLFAERAHPASVRLLVAVDDHAAALAFVPAAELAGGVPDVLAPPPRDAGGRAAHLGLRDLDPRLTALPPAIAWLDLARVTPLLAALPVPDGAAAGCRDDIGRIAAVMPRAAFEYLTVDGRQLTMRLVGALAPAARTPLLRLRGELPADDAASAGARAASPPLLAARIALDLDGARAALGELSAALAARPLRCEPIAGLGGWLAGITPSVDLALGHGARGLEVQVDGFDLAASKLRGAVTLVSAQGWSLATMLLHAIPNFSGLTLAASGQPLELPLVGLKLVGPAFLAATDDRAVITIGEDARARAVERAGATLLPTGPLIHVDVDLRAMTAISGGDAQLANRLGVVTLAADVDERGITVDLVARP